MQIMHAIIGVAAGAVAIICQMEYTADDNLFMDQLIDEADVESCSRGNLLRLTVSSPSAA